MNRPLKCEHTGCGCMAADGDAFCSPACREAAESQEHGKGGMKSCGCGHPGCLAGAHQAAQHGSRGVQKQPSR